MNQDNETLQLFEGLDEDARKELIQFERERRRKFYSTLGLFIGFFFIALLIGISFLGDKIEGFNLSSFSSVFEVIAALSLSLASGVTTIISFKSKKEIKNSTLKGFIKHTYLTKLNESLLNPKHSILKQ